MSGGHRIFASNSHRAALVPWHRTVPDSPVKTGQTNAEFAPGRGLLASILRTSPSSQHHNRTTLTPAEALSVFRRNRDASFGTSTASSWSACLATKASQHAEACCPFPSNLDHWYAPHLASPGRVTCNMNARMAKPCFWLVSTPTWLRTSDLLVEPSLLGG